MNLEGGHKYFPAEFYKEMFRLEKWTYDEKSIKRPSVIGHYINNIVYKRLAPAVLKELQRKNPITEKGYRKQATSFINWEKQALQTS